MYRENYKENKKRNIKISFMFVLSIISLLAICSYTIGYTRYLKETDSKFKGINEDKSSDLKRADTYASNNVKEESKVVDANVNETRIKSTTIYKVIEVDLVTTRQSESIKDIPKSFVGLSLEQLDKYYENYIQNISVEEVAKGLQTINIVSFSKEQVVIEKIYDASKVGYYIVDKAGEIKVFYNDKRTLYENTGIITSELPQSEKDVLEEGIYVDSTEEVLAILESYSS